MSKYKIVTASNSDYFHSLMTLITTNFHRNDSQIELEIWDLGLTEIQLSVLELPLNQRVTIKKMEQLGKPPFKDAFATFPKTFTWKPWIIRHSLRNTEYLFWVDSGVAILGGLEKLKEIYEFEDQILFENNNCLNSEYTSDSCVKIMDATNIELSSNQIHCNVLGFANTASSIALLNQWCDWMAIPDVAYSDDLNHRHDQSVLSILAARNKLKLANAQLFIEEGIDFNFAINNGKLFLAHRRKFSWIDFNSILNI
jgi:hypothetical protein